MKWSDKDNTQDRKLSRSCLFKFEFFREPFISTGLAILLWSSIKNIFSQRNKRTCDRKKNIATTISEDYWEFRLDYLREMYKQANTRRMEDDVCSVLSHRGNSTFNWRSRQYVMVTRGRPEQRLHLDRLFLLFFFCQVA